MGNPFLELPYVLQAKGLHLVSGKEVVMEEARTSYLLMSPSPKSNALSQSHRGICPLVFICWSDDDITWFFLSKKDCQGWIRSGDLWSHSPAWSRRAIKALGCSSDFGEVEFTFVGWPIVVLSQWGPPYGYRSCCHLFVSSMKLSSFKVKMAAPMAEPWDFSVEYSFLWESSWHAGAMPKFLANSGLREFSTFWTINTFWSQV